MTNTLRLTWAIPVNAYLLGARLEAYVESKATISTFKLCALHGDTSVIPLARLPAEILEIVIGYLELPFFEERAQKSLDITDCFQGIYHECFDNADPEAHYQDMEIHLDMIAGGIPATTQSKAFALYRKVHYLHPDNSTFNVNDNSRYSNKILASRSTSTLYANGMTPHSTFLAK